MSYTIYYQKNKKMIINREKDYYQNEKKKLQRASKT